MRSAAVGNEALPLRTRHSAKTAVGAALALLIGLAFRAPSIHAQKSNDRLLRAMCAGATGSVTARDALDRLQKLDRTNPDVSSAISQCGQRVKQLESEEDKKFDQANQALMNGECLQAAQIYRFLATAGTKYKKSAQEKYNSAISDCSQKGAAPVRGGSCDPGTLTMVDALFRAKKYLEARNKAQSLVLNCTDQVTKGQAEEWIRKITRREKANQLREEAVVKINYRQFDLACEKIREIQSTESDYPELPDLLRKAEGCVRNDLMNTKHAEAKKLLEENRLKEAQATLNEIRSANSDYPGLKDLQSEIDGGLEGEYEKAGRFLEQRNWNKASGVLRRIMEVNPGYKDATALLSKSDTEARKEQEIIQATNAEATLLTAIESFYSGKYEKARLDLEAFVKDSRWPRLRAIGRFYLAAAILSQYFLSGATEEKRKVEAIAVFRQQVKDYSSFQPPWDSISPKIKAAYDQVSGIKP
jgi:hypothetical protein